jgi:adenine/guanine phosphoribosyltransferase-like PRPP-binding protein
MTSGASFNNHSIILERLLMQLESFIRDIPDFPKPGIMFKDITPLLSDPNAFQSSINSLQELVKSVKIDAIAAAEARGFLFAAPLALLLKKPLILLRKPGNMAVQNCICTPMRLSQATIYCSLMMFWLLAGQ